MLASPFAQWYVDAEAGDDTNEGASENEPLKTIQHAIDVAEAGQKVVVADGTYGPINSANKAITIQSANGAAMTIIGGGDDLVAAGCRRGRLPGLSWHEERQRLRSRHRHHHGNDLCRRKRGRQQDLLLFGEGRRRVLRQRLQRFRPW